LTTRDWTRRDLVEAYFRDKIDIWDDEGNDPYFPDNGDEHVWWIQNCSRYRFVFGPFYWFGRREVKALYKKVLPFKGSILPDEKPEEGVDAAEPEDDGSDAESKGSDGDDSSDEDDDDDHRKTEEELAQEEEWFQNDQYVLLIFISHTYANTYKQHSASRSRLAETRHNTRE
jgi:hypothetical protein